MVIGWRRGQALKPLSGDWHLQDLRRHASTWTKPAVVLSVLSREPGLVSHSCQLSAAYPASLTNNASSCSLGATRLPPFILASASMSN